MRFQQYHSGRNNQLQVCSHHRRQKGPRQVHKRLAKIQLVLETIQLNNYNRKDGDKKPGNRRPRKDSTNSSSGDEPIGHTNQTRKRKPTFNEKRNFSNENCRFCGKPNWSLEHICRARRSQCNNCIKMRHFAKLCKSKTVNRICEAPSFIIDTGSPVTIIPPIINPMELRKQRKVS